MDNIDHWIKNKPSLADSNTPIHYMSLTVEGNDYEVLKGAARNLARVQYLDLQYNWRGDWGTRERSMKDLIFRLKKKGFVCYWPGKLQVHHSLYNLSFDMNDLRNSRLIALSP